MKIKVAKIVWKDACDNGDDTPVGEWSKIEDLKGLVEVTTVGMMIKEDDEKYCIAHSHYGDSFGGIIFIPKPVVDIQYLTEI